MCLAGIGSYLLFSGSNSLARSSQYSASMPMTSEVNSLLPALGLRRDTLVYLFPGDL